MLSCDKGAEMRFTRDPVKHILHWDSFVSALQYDVLCNVDIDIGYVPQSSFSSFFS